jgi:hypothetical protein
MGAFSYIIADKLFLSCGLPFGTDFSPANWEIVRQILEQLATALFQDTSLRQKHAKYLKLLHYDRASGKTKHLTFTRAVPDACNPGVIDAAGLLEDTPHHTYVDDDVYVEIFDINRVEQAATASIEAIFILLGHSELERRQDPISFDKLMETMISYINKILGHMINTRELTVAPPDDYVQGVIQLLRTTFGPHRNVFTVPEAEELTGKLGHLSLTAPWLKYLMTHVYASLAHALNMNHWALVRSSASFCEGLKQIKQASNDELGKRDKSYFQAENARRIHRSRRIYPFNKTLRKELNLILQAITSTSIPKAIPISHLIEREYLATAYSDSSLLAMGGFCPKLKIWWYFEWPECIRRQTIRHIKNNASGLLIDI